MSDRWAFVLAIAVCAGALSAVDVPLLGGAVAVAVALVVRWPALLAGGGFVLASALAVRADAGLVPPEPARIAGAYVLLGDPTPERGAVRAEVRVGSRRVEAWARGGAAAALEDRLAGEVVELAGRLGPVPERSRAHLRSRHVAGRLQVEEVGGWRPGSLASRAANRLRRTLDHGAEPLGAERRPLFLGMTIGDDRQQSVEVGDDFRGAGLTHLLVVSGQNVAFVLALAGPVLRRVRLGPRWAATLVVLGGFGLLTRFEPSVLRASAMAALACTAAGLGRVATRLRLLALAVAGVVLLDPLLVDSLGFRLSVGATLGITLLARRLADALPGPRPLAEALGVTFAAQLGVAPVLVPTFGGLPVASLPANLLAAPAVAPVMGWGMTGGVLAGLLGPPCSDLLHLPTSLLLAWVAGVARLAARLPLGSVGTGHLLALVGVGAAAFVSLRAGRRARAAWALPAAAAVLLAPAVVPPDELAARPVARGALVWRNGATVLVLDGADPARLLDGLRRARVDELDVVVSRRGNRTAAGVVAVLRARLPVGAVLAPADHRIRDAVVPARGRDVAVGALVLSVRSITPTLEVDVGGPSGPRRWRPG